MQEITSKDIMETMPDSRTADWQEFMDWMFPSTPEPLKILKENTSEV